MPDPIKHRQYNRIGALTTQINNFCLNMKLTKIILMTKNLLILDDKISLKLCSKNELKF